jgi:hypothetical protein
MKIKWLFIIFLFILNQIHAAEWVDIYSNDSSVEFSTQINIIDNSIEESKTSSFVIMADVKETLYDIWLSVSGDNWDASIGSAFATFYSDGTTYRLPVKVELSGTTEGSVNVDTSLTINNNSRPTGSTLTGNAISGTDDTGDQFTITFIVKKDVVGSGVYTDFPSGTYSLLVTINTLLDSQ